MRSTLDLADYRQRVVELHLAEPLGGEAGLEAFRAGRAWTRRHMVERAFEA